MKKRLLWLITGLILIAVGVGLGLPSFLQARESAAVPKVAASPFVTPSKPSTSNTEQTVARIEGKPVRIQIPSLKIDLPVIDGYHNVKAQTWTLTKNKVQYAVNTPLANNVEGNTFLYGHNRREVLHSLVKIKLGAEAIITTDNGHVFTYVFKGALETTPSDDSLFKYQGPPILTVQTCSGVWYQNRQLFTFDLKDVQ